jgi:hypothetical protein
MKRRQEFQTETREFVRQTLLETYGRRPSNKIISSVVSRIVKAFEFVVARPARTTAKNNGH